MAWAEPGPGQFNSATGTRNRTGGQYDCCNACGQLARKRWIQREDGQARGDLTAQKSRSRVLCFLSRRAQAAGSFSPAMLLAAVRTQGNTMFRRGSTQKSRVIDEQHGQMSEPASSLSALRLILGQFNRTPTHSARRADGRCDACWGAAEALDLCNLGAVSQFPWGAIFHLGPLQRAGSHNNYPSTCRKSSSSGVCLSCPSAVVLPRPPSEQKSHAAPFLCSSMLAVVGAPRTPSYDFTCKAFIDGCSHSPSRLAVSRVADSAPKSVQARLLCCFGS